MDSISNHNIDILVASAVDNATRIGKPYEVIKTFDDACKHIGEDHQLVKAYRMIDTIEDNKLKAYIQLRVIAEALNTFAEPIDEDAELHTRHIPTFRCYMQYEIDKMDYIEQLNMRLISLKNYDCKYVTAMGFDGTIAVYNSFECSQPIMLNTRELAKYCGKRFIGLFRDCRYTRLNNN